MRIAVLPGGRMEPPAPPGGLLTATTRAWDAYWRSDVARAVTPPDVTAVERLFRYYDEHRRAVRGYQRRRLVEGSQGQPRLSPLFTVVVQLEAVIGRLETQLGLTPMARARLGLNTTALARSLEDLAGLDEPDEVDDPRVQALGGQS